MGFRAGAGETAEGFRHLRLEFGERRGERLAASDEDVVAAFRGGKGARKAQGLFQPAADAVTPDGLGDPFRHGEAEARLVIAILARGHLQLEGAR